MCCTRQAGLKNLSVSTDFNIEAVVMLWAIFSCLTTHQIGQILTLSQYNSKQYYIINYFTYRINLQSCVSGVVGLIGALGYGAYKYNHRGTMSRSLFFVQLRVGAQGMVSIVDLVHFNCWHRYREVNISVKCICNAASRLYAYTEIFLLQGMRRKNLNL